MKKLILFLLGISASIVVQAQVKLGDNPTVIDINSILEIESSQRGILLPRLELSSTSLADPMTRHVEGMFIYNTARLGDVSPGVYYNDGTKWKRIMNSEEVLAILDSVSSGSVVQLTGTGAVNITGLGTLSSPYTISVNEADGDPTNELQNLSLSGNTLQLSNSPNGNSINLSGYDQSASITQLSNQIANINSNDNDSTNELQDISLSGNILSISNSPSGSTVNLSGYDQSADISILTNQIANISSNDNDSTNELQNLSYSSGVLSISNGNSVSLASDGDAWGVTGEDLTSSIYRPGKVAIGTNIAQQEYLYVQGGNNQTIASITGPSSSSELSFRDLSSINWPTSISNVNTKTDGMMIETPLYSHLIFNIRENNPSDGIHIVSNNGTHHVLTANAAGNLGIGMDLPLVTIDVAGAPRSGSYNYSGTSGYFTGNIGSLSNGFEFMHSNQTKGIGIGWDGIYATGSSGTGDVKIRSQSGGGIYLQPNGGGLGELVINGGRMYPNYDNQVYLGASNKRYKAVYSILGVIQTSDARLKTDIKPIDYGLKQVMNLKPVSFKWKDEAESDNLGFLAQELREVVPEVVVGDEATENLGVNYSELLPILTKAIQEQQEEILLLKSQNSELSEHNDQLRTDIESINVILLRNGLISNESSSK